MDKSSNGAYKYGNSLESFLRSLSGKKNGEIAHDISLKTIDILQRYGGNGIAGMADLQKIDMSSIQNIKKEDENSVINIDGFDYNIINIKDNSNLPDGNYYDVGNKKFVVIYNKGANSLEYYPYRKCKKIIDKKTGEVFVEDDLHIKGFVGKIGDILSDTMNIDPKTSMLLDYSAKYKDTIGRYDIGIGYFEGEINNKYGSDEYFGFEGNGIFRLDNGVTLLGNFTVEYYLNTKKIFGTGKIEYPDKKEEMGSRGKDSGLYGRIYKDSD